MSRKSLIAKEAAKIKCCNRYAAQRATLRKILQDQKATITAKLAAQFKLQQLPKRSIRVRLKNRCLLTGRARSIISRFMLSRIKLREHISAGYIPGLKKASW